MALFPTRPTAANAPGPRGPGRGWHARPLAQTGALTVLGLGLLWSYWPTLLTMAERWSHDPQYSHGFLVPVFAALVLWHRRELWPKSLTPSWWGLAILLAATALRLIGAKLYFEALDAISLLPTLAGLCVLVGGWSALRWTWPAVAFLGFMLPLPFQLEMALAHPLRRVATLASTYCLQTLGLPALADGNIILIEDVKLGVIEACSGLGMLMTFFALSTAVTLLIQRRLADKLTIVVSAVPIAVIANVARITTTGLVHYHLGTDTGVLVHDWTGWLMMPLALGLLWLELKFLHHLLVDTEPATPLPLGILGAGRAFPSPPKVNNAPTCDRTAQPAAADLTPTLPTTRSR